jgi:N-acyl-D-amino-acid deacylase
MSEDFDIQFHNGVVVDGTGADPYKGSVGVKDERIVAVGDVKGDAVKVVDAGGHVISPGFIDVHNHVDLSILYFPLAQSFVRQGITSFIGGHCGDSTGPYNEYIGEPWFYVDIYEEVRPTMGRQEWLIPKDEFNIRHKELYGWELDFKTMADYFKKVEETGHTPNMAPMVGHGDIRSYVMGTDYKRYATEAEVKQMTELVDQAMKDGCIGLSVGRTYEPGRWANLEEILECAKVAAQYGGIYNSHSLRSLPRGDKSPDEMPPHPLYGVMEVIEISKKLKMSVQISHLGNQFLVTPPGNLIMDKASATATLAVIDEAVDEGVDIHFDIIPNQNTGGIFVSPSLIGAVLPYYKIAGSPEQLVKAFEMKDLRDDFKKKIEKGENWTINPKFMPDWAEKKFIRVCGEPKFVDKNFKQIADELKLDPLDAVIAVLTADPMTKIETIRSDDDSVKRAYFAHPRMMIGCDTFAVDEKEQCRNPSWMMPNQNAFGGFAYYLRRMVRETKSLTLQEAVRKITSQPANKFKLKDRGMIREGYFADITIWDSETICDNGTQIEPRRYPDGIDYVVINGAMVVEDEKHTGALPGKILYREK